MQCVDEAIDKLIENPLINRKILKNLRRLPIQRFPYRIFYFVINEKIIITAVLHARKNPKEWSERLK